MARTSYVISIIVLLAGLSAAANASAQTASNTSSQQIERDVKALSDASPDVRRAAEVRLYSRGPGYFPAMEAASQRKDLSQDVAAKLKEIVDRVRPWIGPRNRAARKAETAQAWNQSTAIAAYDTAGKRNPKWDAVARQAIQLYTDPKATALSKTRDTLENVIQLGCDDPFILYLEATFVARAGANKSNELEQLYIKAAEGMEQSQYPLIRKCFAYLRCSDFLRNEFDRELRAGRDAPVDKNEIMNHFTIEAQKLWPQVVKTPGVAVDPYMIDLAEEYLKIVPGGGMVPGMPDRKMLYDHFFNEFEGTFPHNSAVLALKGRVYADWAWDARGVGFANTVSPDARKVFRERLGLAEQVLTEAWNLNPNDGAAAATKMLTVELGQGKGRDVMETWYKRAMKADPDDKAACTSKMYYLEPKWYGTPEDMIAFGRELRDQQNWYGGLPFLLVDAHDTLAKYAKNADAYFRVPLVWEDLRSVYKPWLDAWPDNPFVRSRYTYFACRCGQWRVAREQFAILGDKALPAQFGGEEKMEQYRKSAMGGGL